MSQASERVSLSSVQMRARLDRIRKTRRQGMLGIGEILGLAAGAIMLLAVIVVYLYFLVPTRSQVALLLLDRDRLQRQLRSSEEEFHRGEDTQTLVVKITQSLDDFENNRLVERDEGRMFLYEELNQFMRKNGLRNTSGPTYAPLDAVGSNPQGQAAASKSAGAKWQSIYPGIAVSVTVEGPYQNLRHFVRDIEGSKAFIIINAVELERATESNAQLPVQGVGIKSGASNALVSLRLDLATYFQRPALSTVQGASRTLAEH